MPIPDLSNTLNNTRGNPLEVLNQHLGTMTDLLRAQGATLTRIAGASNPHVAVVARTNDDGVWHSFCFACTEAEHEFVYPCRESPDPHFWPPQILMQLPPTPEASGRQS